MSEEAVILHGAPTLAGLKTASLFRCAYDSADSMRASLREWNRRFAKKGLRVVPLTFCDNKALLYLYRPSRLMRDLADDSALRILSDCGYTDASPARCLCCLAKRIRSGEPFPHEIGLFLGYPPEDVRGFIEQRECDPQVRRLLEGLRRLRARAANVSKAAQMQRGLSSPLAQRRIDRSPDRPRKRIVGQEAVNCVKPKTSPRREGGLRSKTEGLLCLTTGRRGRRPLQSENDPTAFSFEEKVSPAGDG